MIGASCQAFIQAFAELNDNYYRYQDCSCQAYIFDLHQIAAQKLLSSGTATACAIIIAMQIILIYI